ncbi:hypothetical protein SEPCBS57363_004998 [Sporothrix epigloea]|uniref:U4/U6.U5 tri-snRNP-associated protein 1 n=1 Tax=Sporothrix epigloea TaxID=1892477 RepID=A0ABP0DWA4_9PEZI
MDLASLEEANRLRESMGLKPLPIPGRDPKSNDSDDDDDKDEEDDEDPLATLDGRHAAAYDNYKKMQDAELAKRRREEKAAAVKRAREQAQRHTVLEGKSLGDLDNDVGGAEGDAKAWLRGQKKRQKKITKTEEKQLADEAAAAEKARRQRRRAAGAADDDDDDDNQGGLKVGHDMAALLDNGDQILTLKDAGVLGSDGEGDELENLGLREEEELQERLKLKKKRPLYDPLNDDENSDTILGQYDEEIFGKKRKHFTLDPNAILGLEGSSSSKPGAPSTNAAAVSKAQQQVGIDDILNGMPSSDYLDASEIKIKRSKKKSSKKKKTRTRGGDDDEGLFPLATGNDEKNNGEAEGEDATMDVDDGAAVAGDLASKRRKRRAMDTEDLFRDDDDLQASLAVQRREALKKRKRLRPEDLAKQLREASAASDGEVEGKSENGENGENGDVAPAVVGLVIDETAEFISNLKRHEDREDDAPRPRKQAPTSSLTAMEESDDNEDVEMNEKDADDEDGEIRLHEGRSNHGPGGLEAEKKIGQGMGATLSILRERGILEVEDKEEDEGGAQRNARMRAHQQFVTEKRVQLAKMDEEARRRREQDRTSGPMSRMTVREREEYARKQNAQREFQTSRMLQDMFNKSYTPNFKLEYIDEHGRELNQKEAFRALSHGFHGKASGSGKTDKMLKKIDAEKRHMAEGILDASQNVGMSSATAQQLKKRKEAGIRLD